MPVRARSLSTLHDRRASAHEVFTPYLPAAIFTYRAPQLKFGPDAADEIGFDLTQFGARRALIVTDSGIAASATPNRIADQMVPLGIEAHVFDSSPPAPSR
jgi:hydroxyacid-oxoacid transhydrogenase